MTPTLRVLAVTGPHWPVRPVGVTVRSFAAGTPFSLQNAVRAAAGRAEKGVGAWADSNWTTLEGRRESVLLLEFMDEARATIERLIEELRPNLALIGAMTLGFRGAIELARMVRATRGDECLVVLGGKHANETLRRNGDAAVLLPCCPLELMRTGAIEMHEGRPLFDVVVSGEGEDVVIALGEHVHAAAKAGIPAELAPIDRRAIQGVRGDWVLGQCTEGRIDTTLSSRIPLNFDEIPTAPAMFGLQSRFPIFDEVPTGHAYSDMGRGCHYNCFFCSERSGLNGKLRKGPDVVERLLEHLEDIWKAGGCGKQGEVGAFIEDSILLGGEDRLIENFVMKLRSNRLKRLRIGCQMTVNDVTRLAKANLLNQLASAGVDYIAVGMETVNEGVASRMSKNKKQALWSEYNRRAIKALSLAGIRVGVYVLWGLGETQLEREHQLWQLKEWREYYSGQPCAIGLNWATLHPAGDCMVSEADWRWPVLDPLQEHAVQLPDFLSWGSSHDSKRLPILVELFGEASEAYPYYQGIQPSEDGLKRLKQIYLTLMEEV